MSPMTLPVVSEWSARSRAVGVGGLWAAEGREPLRRSPGAPGPQIMRLFNQL